MQRTFLLLCLILIFPATSLLAQSVGVNATGNNPDPSAMLDVESTTQGMLVPRMTSSQRTNISSPATGLLVYDIDTQSFWYYDGGAWTNLIVESPSRLADADGNTQIQVEESPDDNTIRFDVDGSEAMVLNPDGSLGLGTASPQAALHLEGGQVLMRGDYVNNYSGAIPDSGAGTRLMWIPQKAAFRVGSVNGTQWDLDSIGRYSSVAGGYNNTALGTTALVGGGAFNTASGNHSFVGGGEFNTASEIYSSVGGGESNTASGYGSFVGGGAFNIASEIYSSVGGGRINTASGHGSFVGGGQFNTASGEYSFVGGGYLNEAYSYGEAVLGIFAETYTPASVSAFNATDRLFVVGNGTGSTNRSNAMTLYKGGQLVFKGEYVPGYSDALPATGAGTRMMWVPQKSAFRVGNVTGTQWDQDSVGVYSTVTGGRDNKAKGLFSFIGGGSGNTASGAFSVVGGGIGNQAPSYGEAVLGIYPETYTPQSTVGFSFADRLFVVGNGLNSSNRSNAMTLYKGGQLVFKGEYVPGYSGALPATGAGTRMMWVPQKVAFRVGNVTGSQWDQDSVGVYSTVTGGRDNKAKGLFSVVGGGKANTAEGNESTVSGGDNNLASAIGSTVGGGLSNTASGAFSVVGGGGRQHRLGELFLRRGGMAKRSLLLWGGRPGRIRGTLYACKHGKLQLKRPPLRGRKWDQLHEPL